MNKPTGLLIVDDEVPVLMALERAIRRHFGPRLVVSATPEPEIALARLVARDFAVVMSDLHMPAMDGIAFLRQAAAIRPDSVRLVLTGAADFASAQEAINHTGVFRYLCKPWQDVDLLTQLEAALALAEQRWLQRQMVLHGTAAAATPQAVEALKLEALEPGITHVDWGPHGEVLMPPLGASD